jgi:cytochrome c biogenesis protein CcmG, thiol:disulfide interchange protein DsbE
VRRALPLLLAAALAAVLVVGLTQAGGEDPDPAGDGPTAAETAEALAGASEPLARLYERAGAIEEAAPRDLEAQLRALRGYPVVVNAWASWCGPCKLEFPLFRRAATRVGEEVAFLGVNVQDNRGDAERFLASSPVPYPHLEDADGAIMREAAKGARGLPVTLFYDAEGELAYVHQGGYRTEQDLLDDIERHARPWRPPA